MQQLTVRSGDINLNVRVWESTGKDKPTVVLVHGFPDNSLVWTDLAIRLLPYYRVAAYDVRGAGESDIPSRTADYRLQRLVEDLKAVIDTVSPAKPVHLAGHDWGSIQCWEAVSTPLLQGRVASFTSISGPSLDHAAFWLRDGFRRHDPARTGRVLNQLLHSWYIASFHLPVIPRLTWRIAFNKWPAAIAQQYRQLAAEDFPTQAMDGFHGIKLYRANFIERLLKPEGRWTDIPVQLVVPTKDRFVTSGLFDDLAGWAPRLWRREVAAGHWVQCSHPELIAGFLREFIDYLEEGAPALGLQAAKIASRT